MISTPISASTNGTATTSSSATAKSVHRTYFINNRGDEAMGTVWSYLDLTPLGRQEFWEDSPDGYPQTAPYKWWNWHDNYETGKAVDPRWVEVSDAGEAAFRNKEEGARP